MSRAEELANRLASGWPQLDDINAVVPELRRLAQVEADHAALLKAISDAVPVAYLIERHSFYASQHGQDAEGRDWLEVTDQKEVGSFPVYTLNGIKK